MSIFFMFGVRSDSQRIGRKTVLKIEFQNCRKDSVKVLCFADFQLEVSLKIGTTLENWLI